MCRVRSLYAGCVANCLKMAPAQAITFACTPPHPTTVRMIECLTEFHLHFGKRALHGAEYVLLSLMFLLLGMDQIKPRLKALSGS